MIKLVNESEFANMRQEWNWLLSQSTNNSLFLTHEWLFTWWQIFKDNKQLLIIAVYDNEHQLIGIAPFYIEAACYFKLLSVKALKFLGTNKIDPDYLTIITNPGCTKRVIHEVFEWLYGNRHLWDIMLLENILQHEHELVAIVDFLNDKKWRFLIRDHGVCPYIELPKQVDDYLKGFAHKSRYNLIKSERLVRNNFAYEYGESKTARDADQLLEQLFELHQMRAKAMHRESAFDSDLIRKFHKQLIPLLFDKGIYKLYYLKLNGKIECCLYAFIYNGIFYFYQSGFNPELAKFSLGNIILLNTIREAIEQNCFQYDFLKGNEPYKSRWAQSQKITLALLICGSKIKAVLYFSIIKLKSKISAIMKGNYAKRKSCS
ncbi:MAG: GNAT family N-acetyltransferase [candidate division KSB1 bacterium]|nr:GNAT family N-acetyltransferase [candidate division KSB1 bacterium]